MAFATAPDGVRLYFEETGTGTPVLFIHEFADDHRGWEPQVRELGRRYRCITFDARGFPPSDVPTDPGAYSQETAVDDAIAVLDHLRIDKAHIVGLSMGGLCCLHLGLRHPERARSLVAGGVGYGAEPERRQGFRDESEANARGFETDPRAITEKYALGPARVQFQNKDPRGWSEFARRLAEHSPAGSALTLRGVQMRRPSLYDLRDELAMLAMPTLIIAGDEDEGALETSLMLKRTIPAAALAILPRTGHVCNLEEPALFNRLVGDFLATVDADRWTTRDPRSISSGLTI